MIRAIVFDWGDTIMRNIPGQSGPMAHWPRVEPVAGVEEALRTLRPIYQLVLATNARDSDAELVRAALRRLGLQDCFHFVFTARDLGVTKPDVRFFRAISLRLGCRPEEVVMVGDDYAADVVGAKGAGWQAIWFNPVGAACPCAHPQHGAEVAAMADLPSALEGLSSIEGMEGQAAKQADVGSRE
jgi:HAD superfamily hydrolase (TIGR01509 family)